MMPQHSDNSGLRSTDAATPAARYAKLLLRATHSGPSTAHAQQVFAQRPFAQPPLDALADEPDGQPLDLRRAAECIADDWARSGLMPLCGVADGPALRAAHAIPTCASGALTALRELSGVNVLPGRTGATLLSERAAFHGWPRRGQTSVNGHCHLLPSADGWVALNLARSEDIELLPALFAPIMSSRETDGVLAVDLAVIHACVVRMDTATLLQRGRLLGLAIAAPSEPTLHASAQWQRVLCTGEHRQRRPDERPKVLDLSALWAGPLCTHLLAAAGATVTKVESATRPDASRSGLPAFFELLNAGKTQHMLDITRAAGIAALRDMIAGADIVVESARPRALQTLGIDAADCIQQHPGLVWLRITGHGCADERADWVAFGDDAAIAGGAAITSERGPLFCGDALADPLTGLHAAVAAWQSWQTGRAALLDVSLAGVTAWCVQFARDVPCLSPRADAIARPAHR